MLRERTDILEKGMNLSHRQLKTSHQETAAMETTIQQMKDRMQQMTEHIMSLTDKKFEVKVSSSFFAQHPFVCVPKIRDLLIPLLFPKYLGAGAGVLFESLHQACLVTGLMCDTPFVAAPDRGGQAFAEAGRQ